MSKKMFDFVIGNPPYQETGIGKNSKEPSVYNYFLEEAYKVANSVEMIHPARFLFNAGDTDKKWNKKMLSDPHLKVLDYKSLSSTVFPNTDVKGGIAITYRDTNKNFGPIVNFYKVPELNTISKKVLNSENYDFKPFSKIVYSPVAYKFTQCMHDENPQLKAKLSKGNEYEVKTNVFDTIPEVFFDDKPKDGSHYVKILGRKNKQRVYRYIKEQYIENKTNLNSYKAVMPEATGIGKFGEAIYPPHVEGPGIGFTQTFISMGCFDHPYEAESIVKYIKSKFCRTMLGTLKVTQHTSISAWKNVPQQDFSPQSDIDWSQSIHDIDQQLYKKYGLSREEIDFIETNVKEMV